MISLREKLVQGAAWLTGVLWLGAMLVTIGYLARQGVGSLSLGRIFGNVSPWAALTLQQRVLDGLFPAMVGTVVLVLLAVSLALPLGLAAGVYLAEFARGRSRRLLDLMFDIMAGLPSIVVGLFGLTLAILLHRHLSDRIQPCLLISAVALAFLVLPYIVRATQLALEHLPQQLRLTAPALGASRMQNIIQVLLPRAAGGIVSGVVLAIGRCAEDTAVIMLTGAVASAGIPASLLSKYEALPFFIYSISSQYSDRQELATGYGASLLLLLLCMMLFLTAYVIRRGVRWFGLSLGWIC